MDAKVFEKEKEKILKNATKYKALNRIKDMLDEKAKNPDVVNYGETDFDYNDQDVACADFGWPDEVAWHECAIKIIEEFIQKQGWEWEITRVVSDAVPKYYHGVLRHKSGAKSPGGLRKSQTSAPSSPKQTEEPVKKSKSKLGGLFGKKKKVAGGSASSGRSEKGGKNKDDAEASDEEDPDDFYFSLDSAGRK